MDLCQRVLGKQSEPLTNKSSFKILVFMWPKFRGHQ